MATGTKFGPELVPSQANHSIGEADERHVILHRIASSPAFQKSNRLRDLLLYIGERSLREPHMAIREQEIGVEVFGRPVDFDTSQDTLVRVQASQLRKRLQRYFEENIDEAVIVEIPKGAYSLVFRPRDLEIPEPPAVEKQVAAQKFSRPMLVIGALMALLSILSISLAIQNHDLRQKANFGLGYKPTVDKLWKQLFGNNRHTYLVLADTNLLTFEDTIQHQLSIPEYQNKNFERLAERVEDPNIRRLLLAYLNRSATTMGDANIAKRMGLVFASNQTIFDAVLARDMTISQVASDNTILIGSRRANPWVMLFEDKLNFQTVFTESPRGVAFINTVPSAGELARYAGDWSRKGYCRVAFLQSTKGTGNVLLISGTDVASSEAGSEFVTSEGAIMKLRDQLGVGSYEALPHFEVLLETQLVNNTVSQYKLVSVRRK